MSLKKFMDYAAAPVSFHVFGLAVSMAQLLHAKVYGGEACGAPLTVFLAVTGIHAMVCSLIGLIYANSHSSKETNKADANNELRKRASALGIRLTDSVMLDDRLKEGESLEMSASVAESVKFDESVEGNSFMKKKKPAKKPGKDKGKPGDQDPTNEALSLIGESSVKIMDFLFRFGWLVAGSTWVYTSSTSTCGMELYWGTYVFTSLGWVNFIVTMIATITSLAYALNSQ